jgi:hypothetical protein
MSDFTAGPPAGDHDGGSDSTGDGPPVVLLAALATAAVIAVGLIAAFASLGGDGSGQSADRPAGATTTTADKRVLLTVSVDGSGVGRVEITPSDVSCNRSCEYKFMSGARVTASAQASEGSTFDGWTDACSGKKRCSFVMDRPRTLSATFTENPATPPLCENVAPEELDPSCPAPEETGTTTQPPEPGPDCSDGIDNDDDGLTDSAQDPDCATSGTESGTVTPPVTTPPPATTATDDCSDGIDNDHDGLTDRAQDPNCTKGHSESGAAVRAAPKRSGHTPSECSDGRDNDGDGLIDSAQDPGCVANSTEAG